MKPISAVIRLVVTAAACICLTGCFGFLKPSGPTTRYFVLTSLPAATATPAASPPSSPIALGVGFVKVPPYLYEKSIAYRKSANEVAYLDADLWAERLDSGFQRVLAANLSTLLPTDRVRLSTWRAEDVNAEVYVAIEQFDVDKNGRGILIAWWRILSPGGEKVLASGQFRAARPGTPPATDPQDTATTMSALVADLSREIAQAIKAAAP